MILRDSRNVRTERKRDDAPGEALSTSAAYEDMLSIVCHDLRNPLAAIALHAARLRRSVTGREEGELLDSVTAILRSTVCMERLISDLLDTSCIKSGRLSVDLAAHSLNDLLENVLELRPLALANGIDLLIQPRANRLIYCDPTRMGQVLFNLVGNAIKFGPRGTTVHLSADDTEDGLQLSISDEGPGIARELIPRIFERFWRGHGGEGVGLGLHIAKRIVEQHGGRLWVESQLGVGSTFYVFLPVPPARSSTVGPRRA